MSARTWILVGFLGTIHRLIVTSCLGRADMHTNPLRMVHLVTGIRWGVRRFVPLRIPTFGRHKKAEFYNSTRI
jgi:hypothetical protein